MNYWVAAAWLFSASIAVSQVQAGILDRLVGQAVCDCLKRDRDARKAQFLFHYEMWPRDPVQERTQESLDELPAAGEYFSRPIPYWPAKRTHYVSYVSAANVWSNNCHRVDVEPSRLWDDNCHAGGVDEADEDCANPSFSEMLQQDGPAVRAQALFLINYLAGLVGYHKQDVERVITEFQI